MPHISLAAETLTTFAGIPVTNSLVTTYVVMVLLIFGSFLISRNLSLVPGKVQSVAEIVIGGLYEFFTSVTGKHIREFFPLLASIFIFVIVSNWIGLLPGIGTIGFFHEETVLSPSQSIDVEQRTVESFLPLFRAPTADLNTTIALALVAVFAIQYYGFKLAGLHYSTRFLNFSNPLLFGVGILELASEFSKIISFAFRLFGNIFAGEVLLAVIAFLIPVIVPLPFLTLELFVGFIQALVFSMLTGVFLNVAVAHGEEHREGVNVHG